MRPKPEIIETRDGSHTLYLKEMDEPYHSTFGAITESKHVFIDAGLKAVSGKHLKILEMGFGTGLNAFLTLIESIEGGLKIHYTGLDLYPLDLELLGSLNYKSRFPREFSKFLDRINESAWGIPKEIRKDFILEKIEGDIAELDVTEIYNLVYFDAFGPDKQPTLWTSEIFSRIAASTKTGGLLTTYSSKGQVRRNLSASGFRVEKLPGPPGKRDMTRAWKC
jgi:tRNA U34 5-methylaminomethyl-2-thiouridine-forming methyltransferase MnmC